MNAALEKFFTHVPHVNTPEHWKQLRGVVASELMDRGEAFASAFEKADTIAFQACAKATVQTIRQILETEMSPSRAGERRALDTVEKGIDLG